MPLDFSTGTLDLYLLCFVRQCNGSDTQNSYPVHAENVIIKPSELDDGTTASNKVYIEVFKWKQLYLV